MLHEIHCQRNFFKCVCGEFLNKSERESHEVTLHKPEKCEHCRLIAPAYEMAKHKCEKLPKPCTFCSAVIIYDDYIEHVRNCGSRTQLCPICKKFVQTWEYAKHEASCVPPDPEPVPPPQKPNRFLHHERKTKADIDTKLPLVERRIRSEEEKKAINRSEPVPKPATKKPAEVVAKPVESATKPGRAIPTLPGKVAVVATKPTASVGTKGKQPGPRTHDSDPIPSKALVDVGAKKRVEKVDDFEDDEGDEQLVKPREVIEDEDEELARVMAESMMDAHPPSSKPRKEPEPSRPSHTKPKTAVEDGDEELARAYADSITDTPPARKDPVVQPRTDRRVLDTSDATLARVIQESMGGMQGGEEWVGDEDPEMTEVILKSLKEK